MHPIRTASLAAGLASLSAIPALAQPAGVTPPEDVFVEATLADGAIALSAESITLTRGGYYRLNFSCLDAGGEPEMGFGVGDLVRDSHLRVLTVDNIEVYLQGLSFRLIQCEGPGSVRFSFYPMRTGTYEIEVEDEEMKASRRRSP